MYPPISCLRAQRDQAKRCAVVQKPAPIKRPDRPPLEGMKVPTTPVRNRYRHTYPPESKVETASFRLNAQIDLSVIQAVCLEVRTQNCTPGQAALSLHNTSSHGKS